jgi:hypothetical protein
VTYPAALPDEAVRSMPLYGRVTFALGPRVSGEAPSVPSLHLFSDGLARIVGNFVSGRGGGISTLADERTFMLALRRLAEAATVHAVVRDAPTRRGSARSATRTCSTIPCTAPPSS